MHKGVFIGAEARNQPKRILILGESHYGVQESTTAVIERYFLEPGDISYRFFDRIVETFGYAKDNREQFWAKVYFGNYIDVSCGVGDGQAQAAIKCNRAKCNEDLIAFITREEIDYAFCFSRLVYNHLPKLCKVNGDAESCILEDRTHYLMKCVYYPGQRSDMKRWVEKPLVVYGLKHPSRGYSPQKYRNAIADILNK